MVGGAGTGSEDERKIVQVCLEQPDVMGGVVCSDYDAYMAYEKQDLEEQKEKWKRLRRWASGEDCLVVLLQ
jgi:hypothetical protein